MRHQCVGFCVAAQPQNILTVHAVRTVVEFLIVGPCGKCKSVGNGKSFDFLLFRYEQVLLLLLSFQRVVRGTYWIFLSN